MNYNKSSNETLRKKNDFRNIEGNETQRLANKQLMKTQSLWLEIPRNKTHMDKNKSLVSFGSTEIILK